MRPFLFVTLCVLLAGCTESRPPATTSQPANLGPKADTKDHAARPAEPADRTNTGVNVRDRDSAAKTPLEQNENQTDINTTADIRKRIVAAKMSTEATNVKVITQSGKVTLRGPVPTNEEKESIEEIAHRVAGKDNVDSQLEVSSK